MTQNQRTPEQIQNFRAQLEAAFISSTSPRAHRAMEDFKDGAQASGCIGTAIAAEKIERTRWVETALKPWAKRHGLTLKQALSVAFDDRPFNPKDRERDQVTMNSLLWVGGQHEDFVEYLSQHPEPVEVSTAAPSGTSTMRRWDVENGSEPALPNEPTYKAEVTHGNGSIHIKIFPDVILPEGLAHWPELGLGVEINEGLPCVHIHTGSVDELQASIFGMPDGGIMIRNGDAGPLDYKIAGPDFMPDLEAAAAIFSGEAPPPDPLSTSATPRG